MFDEQVTGIEEDYWQVTRDKKACDNGKILIYSYNTLKV